ncbi:MAG TPA: phosphatase PAP2 family protein [Halanaerobiales bacterium]|nr:phosphatase PAP2 family protein [Halanaerobiales bacterium]
MEVVKFIQSFSNPFLDRFFQLFTMIGEDYFFILVMALVYWCLDKNFGYRLGFAYLSSGGLNCIIKEIFAVPRLIGKEGIRSLRVETAGGYSFPSGHTQTTATLWTSLLLKIKKRWFTILAFFIIFLVGFSRLYLGVHRPVDVVFGFLIGFAWVFFVNYLFELAVESGRKSWLLLLILPAIVGLIFVRTFTYYKVVGTLLSIFTGFLVEPVYIRYKSDGALWQQGIKLIVGLAVLLFLQSFLKNLLPEAPGADLLRYYLMGIWVTIIAPFLFKYFFNRGNRKQIKS